MEPLELNLELIGIQRKGGKIVGKEVMVTATLPPIGFAKVPKLLQGAIAEHEAAVRKRNGT